MENTSAKTYWKSLFDMKNPINPMQNPINPIANCIDLLTLPLIPHSFRSGMKGVLNEGVGI